MLPFLKGFAALVVAALATVSTYATLGHLVVPANAAAAVHGAEARPAASTDLEYVAGQFVTGVPAKPAPTPTPTPAPEPATDDSTAAAPPPAAAVTRPAPPVSRPAPPPVVVGSAQQAYINADRAAAGLPPLTWSSCLAGIAAQQSAAMAARGSIFHGSGVTQDFGCGLGSSQTGENVGYWSGGINDAQLNTMFMNSPEHRANIMGPYRYVGTAWVVAANGYGYISVEFG